MLYFIDSFFVKRLVVPVNVKAMNISDMAVKTEVPCHSVAWSDREYPQPVVGFYLKLSTGDVSWMKILE